jgi:hypothetical protein
MSAVLSQTMYYTYGCTTSIPTCVTTRLGLTQIFRGLFDNKSLFDNKPLFELQYGR